MKLDDESAFGAGGKPSSERKSRQPELGLNGACIDTAALRMLFTEMRDELCRFLVRRTGHAALAADLTHDLYEKLSEVRAFIPTLDQARGYIYRMASNLAIDHHKVESRRAELIAQGFHDFKTDICSLEQEVLLQEQIHQVDKALDELPDNVRQVFILLRIDGLPHKEVASRLGISVSSVEKYQVRALEYCKRRLGNEVFVGMCS